tara:strand:- start:1121 stop:1453 length:333 start_codon:yes stop_codon:yes gene_type:complete
MSYLGKEKHTKTHNMAFKLKHSNISPLKINSTLVGGARMASKGFADVRGSYHTGSDVSTQGSTTEESVIESKAKTCTEQGLEGDALVECEAAAKLLSDENADKILNTDAV